MLSGRFVARGIERVTRRALAIDPAAPQGSISLDEVPIELKPLVEALNRAFDEIDAYIKMQRRFLGNAAHQLRTPLTLLRAKIEDVAEPVLKIELVRDFRRLTSLVSAMLDLARLQNHAIEKRPVDLANRDAGRARGFQSLGTGRRNRTVARAGRDGARVVQGVEAAVRSALANLVGNALLHARGARRITACRSAAAACRSAMTAAGIFPPARGKLIEPFQTGNATEDGAGSASRSSRRSWRPTAGSSHHLDAGGGTTASLRFPEATAGTRSETRSASVETA